MELLLPPPVRRGTTTLPDGRALGWSEWGAGPPVLFCPGAATSSRLGLAAGAVEAAGVCLVALDRPGLGASDPMRG
ncbi:alpha/beta hydrolase, partial [Myxococcota bacterium]|nr:alpha/beta hydrolase [Myxococcota bacterium]